MILSSLSSLKLWAQYINQCKLIIFHTRIDFDVLKIIEECYRPKPFLIITISIPHMFYITYRKCLTLLFITFPSVRNFWRFRVPILNFTLCSQASQVTDILFFYLVFIRCGKFDIDFFGHLALEIRNAIRMRYRWREPK